VLGVARDLRSGRSLDGPGEAIACQEDPMARCALAQLAVRHRASRASIWWPALTPR